MRPTSQSGLTARVSTVSYTHLGETQYNRVSRFVREIPRELVDLGHTIQEKKPKVEELIPTPAKYSKMKEILQGRNYKPREFKVTKANSLDYEVGDTVRHIKFGVGIVKEIVEGGRDYEDVYKRQVVTAYLGE